MITYDKKESNLLKAMNTDPMLIKDAMVMFSETIVFEDNKAVAIAKIYKKAMESEEWQKVLMTLAIIGIEQIIDSSVKSIIAEGLLGGRIPIPEAVKKAMKDVLKEETKTTKG